MQHRFGAPQIQFAILLLLSLILATGCTNTITIPQNLNQPQSVYILDYGRHSSLLIPTTQPTQHPPQFIEYAYGEWNWYAHQKDGFFNTFPTLFWPTTGTLGRNTWTLTDPIQTQNTDDQISTAAAQHFQAETVFTIPVEASEVTYLLDNLNSRFTQDPEQTPIYNEDFKLYFIPEKKVKYTLFHNCNHEVVDWLRALGCTVQGNGTFADFKINPPPPDTSESAAGATP